MSTSRQTTSMRSTTRSMTMPSARSTRPLGWPCEWSRREAEVTDDEFASACVGSDSAVGCLGHHFRGRRPVHIETGRRLHFGVAGS